MTYEVEINGRVRRVDVEKTPDGFVVSLDGRRRAADVTLINGVCSLILGPAEAGPYEKAEAGPYNRRSYDIAIVENGGGGLSLHVNGRIVTASVGASHASWAGRGLDAGGGAAGPQRITAPMPGKVVKVLVAAGDRVAARQGIVVVEAMKMENELRAPRAGTVTAVQVAEGASVEAGAVLAVIE